MSVPKRTATIVIARQMRRYQPGERVRILKGKLAGQVMTVRCCTAGELFMVETLKRDSMSYGNVEPEFGFTDDEMTAARRAAEKMQGMGSLV